MVPAVTHPWGASVPSDSWEQHSPAQGRPTGVPGTSMSTRRKSVSRAPPEPLSRKEAAGSGAASVSACVAISSGLEDARKQLSHTQRPQQCVWRVEGKLTAQAQRAAERPRAEVSSTGRFATALSPSLGASSPGKRLPSSLVGREVDVLPSGGVLFFL